MTLRLVVGLGLMLFAGGCVSLRPVERVRNSQAPERFLVVNGHTVHVQVAGTGSPVVLIHGFGGSGSTYRKVIAPLANSPPDGHRVITLDLYGFGLTDRPEEPRFYTPAGQAELVLGVLHALGEESAHLVGHSFGGGVALKLAEEHPDRVRSLVLVDTTLPTHSRAPRADLPLYRPLLYLFLRTLGLRRLFVRGALRKAFHDDSLVTPELVTAYRDRLRLHGPASLYRSLTLPIPRRRLDVDLELIAPPTLVVWGKEDALIPVAAGERAAEALDAELVVLDECGHLPMEERAEELVETARRFWKRIPN